MAHCSPVTSASEPYRQTDASTSAMHSRILPTRVNKACQRCRRNKIRCDSYRPCSLCIRANTTCMPAFDRTHSQRPMRIRNRVLLDSEAVHRDLDSALVKNSYESASPSQSEVEYSDQVTAQNSYASCTADYPEASSTMGITRKIFGLHGLNVVEKTTSAIPDGGIYNDLNAANSDARLTVASILGTPLPSKDTMDLLLEEYFDSVHWFSLVIFEPRFRPEYESVADGYAYQSQKGFLLLLSTVLGIAAWYRSKKSSPDDCLPDGDCNAWRVNLLSLPEARFLELMDESSLASIQTSLLLGSYYIYHGRPNSSFALLGATIKTAQAMGLHREPSRDALDKVEERKRIWWTIYTWDRFASVTYGRPLGINDSDCNVSMPADVYERARPKLSQMDVDSVICYSVYQRQLTMLYIIASPLIESIFGMRSSGSERSKCSSNYVSLTHHINQRLNMWRAQLPSSLLFNFQSDIQQNASPRIRAQQLQALALQLTYDNILVILHRPVLVQQIDNLCQAGHVQTSAANHRLASQGGPSPPSSTIDNNLSNSQQWWNAAVRISAVTTLPNITQLATDSHLVAFLAIILFNAAIVMVVCAMSDPLSDRAQEAKRNITRIFRVEEFLGIQSTLSRQSSIVLRDVIQLLLDRETEVMLAPNTPSRNRMTSHSDEESDSKMSASVTVQGVLRDLLPERKVGNTSANSPTPLAVDEEAFILNESLVSMQKVFPGLSSCVPGMDDIESQEPHQTSTHLRKLQPASKANSKLSTAEHTGSGPIDYGCVDSGLYWI
ncbi:fungal-specific transcription factor domain-containing protein, partial [Lipomyces doorenjongii]